MSARSNLKAFQFTLPTQDRGYLAQLQEWANHYHVRLTWGDASVQDRGVMTHSSYPIIQGYHYTNFTFGGPNLRAARGLAAVAIVGSPSVLDQARFLQLPSQPAPLRPTR